MKSLRLLVVEDNDFLRDEICAIVEAPGRAVVGVDSAEAALVAVAQAPFDLVVTDVSLPGMSGIELVNSLLRDQPLLPVILCSGYALPGVESLGRQVRALYKDEVDSRLPALVIELTSRAAASSGG